MILLKKNKYKLIRIVLIVIAGLSICSCQKKRIVIRVVPPSNIYDTDDLAVIDGNYQRALNRCQERLKELPEDSLEAAQVYKQMGGIYAAFLKDKDNALKYIEKAIEIDKREHDELGLAEDYNELSKIYIINHENPEEGLPYLDMAEEIYERYGWTNTLAMGETLAKKGRIYREMGEYKKSIDYLEQAQEIFRENQAEDALVYVNIGRTYIEMGRYVEAEEQFLKAMEIYEISGDDYWMAETSYQMGWLHLIQGNHEEEIFWYEKALEHYNEDNYQDRALIYNNIAVAGYNLGWGPEQVLTMCIKACRDIEKVNPRYPLIEEDIRDYKHNLEMFYKGWTRDMSDEALRRIIKGRFWKEESGIMKMRGNENVFISKHGTPCRA